MAGYKLPDMYEFCLRFSRADRAMRALVAGQLEQHKLTMMEWLALAVVSKGPKEGLSMTHISEALDVTLPQVTALTNRLAKLKLIKQKVLASDRRGRQVVATLKGRRILNRIETAITGIIGKWGEGVPPAEFEAYVRTILTLGGKK